MGTAPKRRVRVPGDRNAGIYTRPDGRLEIGFRDAQGKQRWRAVDGGIMAARAQLATEHAKRGRGSVSPRIRGSRSARPPTGG